MDHTRDETIELAMVPFTYGLDGEIYEVGAAFGALRDVYSDHPVDQLRRVGTLLGQSWRPLALHHQLSGPARISLINPSDTTPCR